MRTFVAVRSAVYAAGFILLWAWLAITVRRFDPRLPFEVAPSLRPVGLTLSMLGTILVMSCIHVFVWRGRGTPAPFDAPRQFVHAGPYRFVRNPMYLGAAAVIAGAGVVLRSPSIILLAGAFLLFFHAFVLLYEEPTLRRRFGSSYVEYTRSVPRWLPWRRHAHGVWAS